jgi:hypothetical protein
MRENTAPGTKYVFADLVSDRFGSWMEKVIPISLVIVFASLLGLFTGILPEFIAYSGVVGVGMLLVTGVVQLWGSLELYDSAGDLIGSLFASDMDKSGWVIVLVLLLIGVVAIVLDFDVTLQRFVYLALCILLVSNSIIMNVVVERYGERWEMENGTDVE